MSDEALVQLQEVLNAFVFYEDMIKDLDMKQLEPPDWEVWEFRSYVIVPYLRLFGCFVVPSHFLAVNHRVRDDLEPHRGPKWDLAIDETIKRRNDLMSTPPCHLNSFGEYLR